jgi:hypothetical protein
MLLSGREIQTTWPPGIGSPSVGAGSRFPCTTTVSAGSFVASLSLEGAVATRNCAFDSSSQTVPATPRA